MASSPAPAICSLRALVACAEVTLRAVVRSLGIAVNAGPSTPRGWPRLPGDAGGKPGRAGGPPADPAALRPRTCPEELATLLKLAERYCVVYQTLTRPPELDVSLAPVPAGGGSARPESARSRPAAATPLAPWRSRAPAATGGTPGGAPFARLMPPGRWDTPAYPTALDSPSVSAAGWTAPARVRHHCGARDARLGREELVARTEAWGLLAGRCSRELPDPALCPGGEQGRLATSTGALYAMCPPRCQRPL
jgi:hypothetical protein